MIETNTAITAWRTDMMCSIDPYSVQETGNTNTHYEQKYCIESLIQYKYYKSKTPYYIITDNIEIYIKELT